MSEFPKHYDPKSTESKIQQLWHERKTDPLPPSTGKTFYIPLPPPNVTGNLHLGHALTLTLQDIMIRYHRMKGDDVVWVPGTDHAGIATQAQVEKRLLNQGKTRKELGREAFLDECWKWIQEYSGNIQNQIRRMGASINWEHERFTLDEKFHSLVEKVFVDLYEKGIIYRGEYMVNYSPGMESVVSDIEVNYEEVTEKMYYINYFVSGSDHELLIATTRPETLLADQAIAVNPKDKRYKKYIGRSVILPIVNREIPIIGDEMVDMEFGTGVVKITPAHDSADFEVARRHNLRTDYQVLDKSGVMNAEAGIFAGMNAMTEARDNIVELLRSKGNLVRIEPYTHKVGFCSRSGTRIESIVSTQWFVRAEDLAKKVIAGYQAQDFTIVPSRFQKIFEDWIYHIHDWCISRQLWWGHQIPAYYDSNSGELLGVTRDIRSIIKAQAEKYQLSLPTSPETADLATYHIRRDEDVLDTWFSSGLWPFAILGWDFESPSPLFEKYYPANVLETGHDIIFFWVIRMLLFGYEYTGTTPFKTLYFHGLVLDEKGKKMSKSWGNVIDPIDTIESFSVDALRLALVLGNTPGNNTAFSLKTVEEYSLFLNKFWNIIRFTWMNVGTMTNSQESLRSLISSNQDKLLPYERWILSRLHHTVETITQSMEQYSFSLAGLDLIAFIRDEFADFAIEAYKIEKDRSAYGKEVLTFVAREILTLMHPYIPHITESLYGYLTGGHLLMHTPWSSPLDHRDENIEGELTMLFSVVRTIRNIRAERNIKPGELRDVWIISDTLTLEGIERSASLLSGLAKIQTLSLGKKPENTTSHAYGVTGAIEIYIDASIDQEAFEMEKNRLKEQIEDKKAYLRAIQAKLSNPSFARNAPEQIVRAEMSKKHQTEEQLQKLQEKYDALNTL